MAYADFSRGGRPCKRHLHIVCVYPKETHASPALGIRLGCWKWEKEGVKGSAMALQCPQFIPLTRQLTGELGAY
jgi:hypothetical protein